MAKALQLAARLAAVLAVLGSWLLLAQPAVAETNFPVIGGSGNGSFEDRCPPQQYMLVVEGRGGDWIDQVQIVCTQYFYANPRQAGAGRRYRLDPPTFDRWYRGPLRGGGGGGPIEANCDGNPIAGMMILMTPGNRQVQSIDVSCSQVMPSATHGASFRARNSRGGVNMGPDRPSYQGCPNGEVAVGVRGRYGIDVNALALICGAFNPLHDPQDTPPPRPPPPPPPPKPIKITGRPAGAAPPAPAPTPAPAADQPAPAPGPFEGDWLVTTSLNNSFGLRLRQPTMVMSGTIRGAAALHTGHVRGKAVSVGHAHITFAEGNGQSGEADLDLARDGQSFVAAGHLNNGSPFTWSATRTAAADQMPPVQPTPGQVGPEPAPPNPAPQP